MNYDPQISKLMGHWKAPAVPGDFDQNVWRRIRTSQPAPNRAWWQNWLYSPLRLGTVAALCVITVGSWAGTRSRAISSPAFSIAATTSVTGSYLDLAKGHLP